MTYILSFVGIHILCPVQQANQAPRNSILSEGGGIWRPRLTHPSIASQLQNKIKQNKNKINTYFYFIFILILFILFLFYFILFPFRLPMGGCPPPLLKAPFWRGSHDFASILPYSSIVSNSLFQKNDVYISFIGIYILISCAKTWFYLVFVLSSKPARPRGIVPLVKGGGVWRPRLTHPPIARQVPGRKWK